MPKKLRCGTVSNTKLNKTIKLNGLVHDSIVDGEGIRLAIFTQGCPHACPGCHNPATHSFSGGTEYSVDDLLKAVDGNPLLDGITLTGGDPMCQADALIDFAIGVKERCLNIWCYTGYTFEQVMNDESMKKLCEYIDVLVDGQFILSERSLDLLYKGSKNQRLIDVQESLKENGIVLWNQ